MQITGKFENERLICNRMERLYLYKNSTQICAQTGFQGYLRGYFNKCGETYFDTYFPHKTPADEGFFEALQKVMDTLREGILKSFRAMKDFCSGDGFDSRFYGNWTEEFAFRIDHKGFAFLFRLIPMPGDYHVYIHCYHADWLDQHMNQAEHGIRFIDSSYQEKFRLEDGGRIRITTLDGNVKERICRFIDDYHVEIGDYLYHICEYGEMCETSGTKVDPVEGLMLRRISPPFIEALAAGEVEPGYVSGYINYWKNHNPASQSITEFLGMTDAEFAEHDKRNICDEEYEKMLLKGPDELLVRFAEARNQKTVAVCPCCGRQFKADKDGHIPERCPECGEVLG